MKTIPFEAHLLLQEMRHYLLIVRVDTLQTEDVDTDEYMMSFSEPVAAVLSVPSSPPDVWVNTYTLFIDQARQFAIGDKTGLEAYAVQCYEALKALAKGLQHRTPCSREIQLSRN